MVVVAFRCTPDNAVHVAEWLRKQTVSHSSLFATMSPLNPHIVCPNKD